ncbi:MAG: hypothetical protein JNL97_14860 [Verrucomicrobiales bacterium]|nr:hypothetical protein [Verrucomicrobiales bacterium]
MNTSLESLTLPGLITLTPSGFEKGSARCAPENVGSDDPNMERLVALAAEHGMDFPDPIAR